MSESGTFETSTDVRYTAESLAILKRLAARDYGPDVPTNHCGRRGLIWLIMRAREFAKHFERKD
jgi:hypothetical protein